MQEHAVDTGFDEVIENPDAVWKELPIAGEASALPSGECDLAVMPDSPATGPRPPGMPELVPVKLAELAREVAMNIREIDDIIAVYKLTREQYDWLATHHEFYKHALHVSTVEWTSALTTPERVRLESAAILEDALPRLGARMVNQAEGLPGVVEAAKLFAKLAGLGEKEVGDRAPGERFKIEINLGADEKLTYQSKPDPVTITIDSAPEETSSG
jgi:hypothetical protein